MHEYGLVQEVVLLLLKKLQEGVCPEAGNMEVVLRVGGFAVHSVAATRQAYEVLTKDTPLESSRLTLTISPVTLNCPGCGYQETLGDDQVDPHDPLPLAECPRCGQVGPVHGGRGVESLELVCD
ncbi:MAG: hydrogenase maturation nickel metallochaperone HypA [Deltaproteobacteria bacterium]|nr:hydrogenase maturation nickel metallochaperone HypA [Deltaproteobacteria bacterium]